MRARRHAVGLTQEELADRAGLSARAISDIERGLRRPFQRTVALLADALGLTGAERDEFARAARPGAGADAGIRTGGEQGRPEQGRPEQGRPEQGRPEQGGRQDMDAGLPTPGAGGYAGRRVIAVPRQLPAPATDFTGREAELRTLTGLLGRGAGRPGTMVVSAIGGTAGVGKTALAVHWAHQVAGQFPDGQLYVNLRGYDPGQPMSPADALAAFLRALGVPGPDIPAEPGECAARYRSLLAGRRVLILLDNAGSVEQVRPLLPGSVTCAVVVTSRDTLAGLVARDGARRIDLDLLSPADAAVLLTTLIGDRAAADPTADPAAIIALATACARLPLALRIAAELASTQAGVPLATLVNELTSEHGRLDLLEAGGDPYTAVRAVFSWSYRHLDDDTARAFRRLGLHPGPDFDAHAVAALCGGTLGQARRQLNLLARAHLIQATRPGRYGLHDLLRAYAAELSAEEDRPGERRAALTRLFDHYLHTAAAAMNTLYPAERHRRPEAPASPGPVPPVTTENAARDWLGTQLATLIAITSDTAGHDLAARVVRLSRTLFRYLDTTSHFREAVTIHSRAVAAARQTGDGEAETLCVNQVCIALMHQGRVEEASRQLGQALTLARRVGYRPGEARTLNNLGVAAMLQGHYGQAREYYQQSLAAYREPPGLTANTLINLSVAEIRQGHYRKATAHLQEALTLKRQAPSISESYVVVNLGIAEFRQGHYRRAAAHLDRALRLFRADYDAQGEALALTYIAWVHSREGGHDQALQQLERALSLFQEVGERAGEIETLNVLGAVLLAAGQPDLARVRHAAALDLACQLGDPYEQARAHDGLGQAWFAAGDRDQAWRHWEQALVRYEDMGTPQAQDLRARLEAR